MLVANEVVKPLEVRPIFPEDEKNDLLDGVARLLDDVHIAQLGSLNLLLCLLADDKALLDANLPLGIRRCADSRKKALRGFGGWGSVYVTSPDSIEKQ